jgi:hypothetical protein
MNKPHLSTRRLQMKRLSLVFGAVLLVFIAFTTHANADSNTLTLLSQRPLVPAYPANPESVADRVISPGTYSLHVADGETVFLKAGKHYLLSGSNIIEPGGHVLYGIDTQLIPLPGAMLKVGSIDGRRTYLQGPGPRLYSEAITLTSGKVRVDVVNTVFSGHYYAGINLWTKAESHDYDVNIDHSFFTNNGLGMGTDLYLTNDRHEGIRKIKVTLSNSVFWDNTGSDLEFSSSGGTDSFQFTATNSGFFSTNSEYQQINFTYTVKPELDVTFRIRFVDSQLSPDTDWNVVISRPGVLEHKNDGTLIVQQTGPKGNLVQLFPELGPNPADFDKSGSVDFPDFVAFARAFGRTGPEIAKFDFDGSGSVDFPDFVFFAKNFGLTHALPVASKPALDPIGVLVALIRENPELYYGLEEFPLLRLAFLEAIGGPIAELERRVPPVFTLHQNFPNPFNPETTIKYDLAEASHVKLRIYNVVGQVVRTLVAEHQPAGQYQVKWNGIDDRGIPVSSGIYLYQISTGKFQDIRRLMLLK